VACNSLDVENSVDRASAIQRQPCQGKARGPHSSVIRKDYGAAPPASDHDLLASDHRGQRSTFPAWSLREGEQHARSDRAQAAGKFARTPRHGRAGGVPPRREPAAPRRATPIIYRNPIESHRNSMEG
jgi:hypothetical protein